jgi:hypothetical protein
LPLVRRLTFLLAAALVLPASAEADVRLGGPLVALSAGPGAAYAVVATGSRNRPFRLVRSGGRGVSRLGVFGSRNAKFADVSGREAVFARPTSDGFVYETAGGTVLDEGTGPPVLSPDGLVYPDADGDVVFGRTVLTHTGPALRHAPLDAVDGPLVLDLVQSGRRTELRVLGPDAPSEAVTSVRGLHVISATIARDDEGIYVAYRSGATVTLATAKTRGRWSRRRLKLKGTTHGAPAIARSGLRTFVATSQRVHRRRSIFLTTIGPAGTFTDRLTKPRGSDLAPLAAQGPDGHVYVAWTRRTNGSSRRSAILRRVL